MSKEAIVATMTVSASQARAEFSKLGEEIVRTGKAVTVFKNSKPWLVISPAAQPEGGVNMDTNRELTQEEKDLLEWTGDFVEEYRDVFEALAK
jgi:antitoxin Phd